MFHVARLQFQTILGLGIVVQMLIFGGWYGQLTSVTSALESGVSGEVAFADQDKGDIFVLDLATNSTRQLTRDHLSADPAWSPDGARIAVTHRPNGQANTDIYLMNPDGTGLTPRGASPADEAFPAWGPDGSLFFVRDDHAVGGNNIDIIRMDRTGAETLVHREQTGLCKATDLSVSPTGTPALMLDCGRGHYVFGVDAASNKLVDLTEHAVPSLQGCADDGVWAHTQAVLGVLFRANCVIGAGASLYTLNFATSAPQSRLLLGGQAVYSVAWSWDDQNLAYTNAAGLWVLDAHGSTHQYSPHGTHLTWRPGTPSPGPRTWVQVANFKAHGLVSDPKTPNVLYSGGDGVFRSLDGGKTWTTLTQAFQPNEVHIAPSDPKILYAGSGEGCAVDYPGQLYRSTDGGHTWAARTAGPYSLDINPTDPAHLVGLRCGGQANVVRSLDGGKTWSQVLGTGILGYDPIKLARGVNNRSYMYIVYQSEGGSERILRTSNDAVSWTALPDTGFYASSDLVIDPVDARHLYYLGWPGFYASANAGDRWSQLNAGLGPTTDPSGPYLELSKLVLDRVSQPPAGAQATLYLGTKGTDRVPAAGVFRWNGNDAWVPFAPAPAQASIVDLLMVNDPGDPALIAATERGVYRLALLPGSVPGSRTFPETGKTVRGLFLDYWQGHGGLAQQGYPLSDEFTEVSDLNGKSYTVQYFERAVFEYHPENAAPNNVLLSQLGTFQYRRKYPAGAPNQTANQTSGHYFAETKHWVGGRFWTYWQQHGGVAQQGFPISDEFREVSDLNGQPYTVQYFERAVFEYHPEKQSPFDVLLSQLGRFQYQHKYPGRILAVGR